MACSNTISSAININENNIDQILDAIVLPDGDCSEYEDDLEMEDDAGNDAVILTPNKLLVQRTRTGLHPETEDDYRLQSDNDSIQQAEAPSSSTIQQNKSAATGKSKPSKIQYKWRKTSFEPTAGVEWNSTPNDVPVSKNKTPLEYFLEFFDEKILDHIVQQSNLYAHQKDGYILNMDVSELRKLLGMLVHMGVVHMPSRR